jgi:hypothetical protein
MSTMMTAQDARPFVREYTAEQKRWLDEVAADWRQQCTEISEEEFWGDMVFAPLKRMGFCDGPGAVFHGEPYNWRNCDISKEKVKTRLAHFVVKDADRKPHYYRWNERITLEEFKALCTVIIPNVGPCAMGWGARL